MDMQRFVQARDRAASPVDHQNGQRTNLDRRTIAAHAKVPLRKAPPHVAEQALPPGSISGLPSRGLGNIQNTSATVQSDSRRHHDNHKQQADAFDTDAESLDTTVDQSMFQTEPGLVKLAPLQQHNSAVDISSDRRTHEDDEYESDEIEYEEVDVDEYVLTPEDRNFLQQHGQQYLSQTEAVEFLLQHRPENFGIVKGDSYPSTTDGHPTEWNGKVEPRSEASDGDDLASPIPRAQEFNHEPLLTPPSMHQGLDGGLAERSDRRSNKLFQQSAQLRDQQRGSGLIGAPVQSSQPPSYSQANQVAVPSQALNPFTRPTQPHDQNAVQPQVQFQGVAQPFNAGRSAVPSQPLPPTRNKVVPVIQHQIIDPVQPQRNNVAPQGDYDLEALNAMDYDDLKREDFDHNPRAPPQLLSDDMQQKPLAERLEHVQHNFDTGKQSQFFSALPTSEWEDAGDWFLEQFGGIIRRTKDARQKKRKLAQGFESEIEKRHEHVSKKQRQVEDAMHKMQAQGEGLVPRSPRHGKSPNPKKR